MFFSSEWTMPNENGWFYEVLKESYQSKTGLSFCGGIHSCDEVLVTQTGSQHGFREADHHPSQGSALWPGTENAGGLFPEEKSSTPESGHK